MNNGDPGRNGSAKQDQRVNSPNLQKPPIEIIALSQRFPNSSDLPTGGSTGLCHESTAAIDEAAAWYRSHRDSCERPIIPALKRRFGLTSAEAVKALCEAGIFAR